MAKSNFLFFQRLLFGLGILYLTVTVFFFLLFGPVTLNFGGFRLSFTSLVNPIRISLGLFLFSFIFKILGDIKGKFTLASVSQKWWGLMKSGGIAEDSPEPEKTQPQHHLWAEVLLLIVIFWGTFFFIRHYTADVAGFADTYGYVSEAVRLSQGHFYEPERIYSRFALPEKAQRSHPLGYTPKGDLGTVPSYPFGYPLILAAFIRIFGLQGAYWVTPLLASGTVILCYFLGRVYFGRLGGLLTAGLTFFFPNFLHSAFFPMSDVPAAFFSELTLVALLTLPTGPLADFILGTSLGCAMSSNRH